MSCILSYNSFQESELQRLAKAREQELRFTKAQADLDVARAEALATVEVKKFEAVIGALGANTIRDIAVAGPEMQVRRVNGGSGRENWGSLEGIGFGKSLRNERTKQTLKGTCNSVV